ncbi:MAG: hypothetical protein H6R11_1638, partial [Proteobacteria bacterium]|nr:hypothetical protein [Pseudomonadota bacterium]
SKYRPRATLGQLEHLGLIEPVGATSAPGSAEEDLPVVADAVETEEELAAASEAPATEPGPEPQPAPPAQAETESPTPTAPEPESESRRAVVVSSSAVEAVAGAESPIQEVPPAVAAAAGGSSEVVPDPQQPVAVAGTEEQVESAPQDQDANAADPGLEPVVADEPPQGPSCGGASGNRVCRHVDCGGCWHRQPLSCWGCSRRGDGPLAQASAVRASPSIHGWSDVERLTVDLAIDGLSLQQGGTAALCGGARLDPSAVRGARLHVVDVSNLSVALGNAVIQDLRGAIEFDRARGTAAVSLADADNRLRATLSPQGRGCRFAATGNNWRLPLRGGLVFFGLNAQGSFDESGMQLAAFDARVSDGIVSGNGELIWSPRANLDLQFELRHVDLAKLLPALGMEAIAHGPLNAKLQVSARPASLGTLGEALSGRGSVAVVHGSVDRFDLAEAARTITRDAVRGGATRFDQLTAQIQFEGGSATLRSLRLDAGALQADGHVSVDGRNRLGGDVIVQIRGSAGQLRVPLQVGGTLAAPELTPTPSPDQPESAATPQATAAAPVR